MRHLSAFILSFAVTASLRAAPPAVAGEAEDTPKAAMGTLIRLLDAGDYRGFVRRAYTPKMLRLRLAYHGGMEKVTDTVAESAEHHLRLYRLLRKGQVIPTDSGVRREATNPATGKTYSENLKWARGQWRIDGYLSR